MRPMRLRQLKLASVADSLAGRFYRGGEEVFALRESGRRHTVISAEPGDETLEALRKALHRLLAVRLG